MPEVLAIEAESFEFAWDEDHFVGALRVCNCVGLVVLEGERIVGFVIYELHKTQIHLLNFAVAPEWRRKAVGAAIVDKLKGKLSALRRTRIVLEVRETNLAAQLFFRSQGFRAVHVLREFYEDTPEDAYVMEYSLPWFAGVLDDYVHGPSVA